MEKWEWDEMETGAKIIYMIVTTIVYVHRIIIGLLFMALIATLLLGAFIVLAGVY